MGPLAALVAAAALVAVASWSAPCDAAEGGGGPGVESAAPDQAPAPALAEDRAPTQAPPAEAALAEELARAEQVRLAQAKLREEIQAQQQPGAAGERRAALAREAREVAPGAAIEASLQRVMTELRALRLEIDSSFQAASTPPSVPHFAPSSGASGAPPGPAAQRLAELQRSLAEEEGALARDAQASARRAGDRLDEAIGAAEELDAARVALLDRASEEQRAELLGVDAEGIEQLRWELWHIRARARWYGLRRGHLGAELLEARRDPFFLTAIAVRFGLVAAVLAAAMYLSVRRQRLIDAVFGAITRVVRRPRVLRGLERARAALSALSGGLVFLVALRVLHGALGPSLARMRGVDLAFSLLYWYAIYRLAVTAAHGWIAHREGAPAGEATSRRILRSVQTVGRYAFGVGLVLALSDLTLGRGYLHHAVVRLAWLGAAVVAAILLRRFRRDIADAYLRRHDAGLLADAVRGTRDRWHGFFVAVLAFAVLALAAAGRLAVRYVLRFEQSHRILAFIFRKRLERRAGGASQGTLAPGLPADLLARLPEEPLQDPQLALDHFTGIDRFDVLFTSWKTSPRIGSLLLVGGAGSGKTTWLAAAERKAAGVPIHRVALKRRLLTAADVVATLASGLDAPPEARADVGALASWLRSLPRRLVVLDDLEHLFLRGLDTWAAWEAFMELIERSAPSVFWLCALAEHPYRYLAFARGGPIVFRVTVQLTPWPEQRLKELLSARTRASGYELLFDDLVMDAEDAANREARSLQTERDFMRLLWDYSQGCPRVALHFWLRSLLPDGEGRLRVRLFSAPNENELEVLSELERFVLASVVWHDSLTTEEAAWSLGYPRLPCDDALAKLVEIGIVDDLGGRHRVTTLWQREVTDFLLRKHLIQP